MGTVEESPLAWAAARVGDRWTLLIVDALLPGPQRFGELAEALPEIATNVLSQRLKRLEADRIVVATAYQTRPPRSSYELERRGRRAWSTPPAARPWRPAGGVPRVTGS
jgi:DNA-binding HxlR family transcriptional regulator